MKKLIALLIGVAAMANGCASLGPEFKPEPPQGKGSVAYIYRVKRFAGSAFAPDVNLDGRIVGEIANGGYLPLHLEPGAHKISLISVGGGPICAMDFTVKPATENYLRFDNSMNNGAKEAATNAQAAALGPGGGGAMGAVMTEGFYASTQEKDQALKNADPQVTQPLNNPGFVFVRPDLGAHEISANRLGKAVP